MAVDINWGLMQPAPNVGEQFGNAFRQGAAQSAMGDLGNNPNDQNALNRLMQFNPQLGFAMQDRQLEQQRQQQQQQQAMLEQHRERIVLGGRLVSEMRPTDQAGWDRVRAAAQNLRIDLSDVPEQFHPAYAEGLVKQANALSPQREQQGPNIQREVEYYRSIGRPDLAQTILENHAQGSPVVFDVNGDGAPDLVPRSYFNQGGQQPTPAAAPQPVRVNTPDEARQLPPGTEFVTPDGRRLRVPGGPTPSASGTFPGSSNEFYDRNAAGGW